MKNELMKKHIKLLQVTMLALGLLFLSAQASFAQATDIVMKVDGNVYTPADKPYFTKGVMCISLDEICKVLGVTSSYDAASKNIFLEKDNSKVKMTLGNYLIYRNELSSDFCCDPPSSMVNGKIVLPLRVLPELFGNEVKWNPKTSTIEIFTKYVPNCKPVTVGRITFDKWVEMPTTCDLASIHNIGVKTYIPTDTTLFNANKLAIDQMEKRKDPTGFLKTFNVYSMQINKEDIKPEATLQDAYDMMKAGLIANCVNTGQLKQKEVDEFMNLVKKDYQAYVNDGREQFMFRDSTKKICVWMENFPGDFSVAAGVDKK